MLADYTSKLHMFLEICLQSNSTTEAITELKWNPDSDIDLITFRKDSQNVNEEDIQPFIDQQLVNEINSQFCAKRKGDPREEFRITPVEVRVLNIGWLLSDCNSFM